MMVEISKALATNRNGKYSEHKIPLLHALSDAYSSKKPNGDLSSLFCINADREILIEYVAKDNGCKCYELTHNPQSEDPPIMISINPDRHSALIYQQINIPTINS